MGSEVPVIGKAAGETKPGAYGLAMVYGIVKQYGGHIDCYSEVGIGTTFKIYLPALLGIDEPAVQETGIMPVFGAATVLLGVDEEFVRELGARILTKQGYTVLQEANGTEALAVYEKEKDRIAHSRSHHAHMGGKDCLQILLEIDQRAKVLIARGYSAEASTKEWLELGARGFVAKPFRFKELLQEVRKALDET